MSIRYGHSWRTRHGRSWVSFPLRLWLVLALPLAAAAMVLGALWVAVWLLTLAVRLGQALVQAWREERAAKAAGR